MDTQWEIELIRQIWPEWQITGLKESGMQASVYHAEQGKDTFLRKAAIKMISFPSVPPEALPDSGMSEVEFAEAVRNYYRPALKTFMEELKVFSDLKSSGAVLAVNDYKILEKEEFPGWLALVSSEDLPTLEEATKDQIMNEHGLMLLASDVARAISMCHKKNLVHLNIRENNIFISDHNTFKLGDPFDLRDTGNMAESVENRPEAAYMPPEIRAGSNYSYNADVYSLGVVLYKLMNSNQPPKYTQESITTTGLPLPPKPNPAQEVTREFVGIVMKACVADPLKRYTSIDAMLADLSRHAVQMSPENAAAAQAAPQAASAASAPVNPGISRGVPAASPAPTPRASMTPGLPKTPPVGASSATARMQAAAAAGMGGRDLPGIGGEVPPIGLAPGDQIKVPPRPSRGKAPARAGKPGNNRLTILLTVLVSLLVVVGIFFFAHSHYSSKDQANISVQTAAPQNTTLQSEAETSGSDEAGESAETEGESAETDEAGESEVIAVEKESQEDEASKAESGSKESEKKGKDDSGEEEEDSYFSKEIMPDDTRFKYITETDGEAIELNINMPDSFFKHEVYMTSVKGYYSGEYDEDGKPHGTGVFSSMDKTEGIWTYSGNWSHGRIEGEGIRIFASVVNPQKIQLREVGEFKEDAIYEGKTEEFFKDKIIVTEGLYHNNGLVQDGSIKGINKAGTLWWYEKGIFNEETQLVEGVKCRACELDDGWHYELHEGVFLGSFAKIKYTEYTKFAFKGYWEVAEYEKGKLGPKTRQDKEPENWYNPSEEFEWYEEN